MCTCIDTITKRLQNETDDSFAALDVASWGGVDGKKIKIRAFYRKKTRGGNLTKKIYQKLIPPIYCPFCGENLTKIEDSI